MKVNKINLDIDNNLNYMEIEKKLYKKYNNLFHSYIIYYSSSKKGLHFEIKLNKFISIEENFKIRKILKDCKQRLKFSKMDWKTNKWNFDFLFTNKKYFNKKTGKTIWKQRKFIKEVFF